MTAELDDEETIKAGEDSESSTPARVQYSPAVAARTQDESTEDGPTFPGFGRRAPKGMWRSLSDELTRDYPLGGARAGAAITVAQDDESTQENAPVAPTSSPPMSSPPGSTFRLAILPRSKDDAPQGPLPLSIGPRFEVRRTLGGGGGGEVTLEYDRDIDRAVAVKRLHSMQPPESLFRFAEEVRTIGGLEHPNIVPIHDVGLDEQQRYYFVMKYVEGETLEKIIQRLAAEDPAYHRRYTTSRRADICMEIMNALAYAHARGIIHRDLKPANIMVGKYGEVMVMDWGVAKRKRDELSSGGPPGIKGAPPQMAAMAPTGGETPNVFNTSNGALIGTPLYMSPEQARGQNSAIDERSDIYSLSVMFHELFALRHYLAGQGDLLAVLSCISEPDDRPLTSFVGDVVQATFPCEIMHFVRKGMRKSPAERYQSMAEMMEAFQRLRSGRFRILCHYTFVKRAAQVVLHSVDDHPIIVTIALALVALAIPAAIALLIRTYL